MLGLHDDALFEVANLEAFEYLLRIAECQCITLNVQVSENMFYCEV